MSFTEREKASSLPLHLRCLASVQKPRIFRFRRVRQSVSVSERNSDQGKPRASRGYMKRGNYACVYRNPGNWYTLVCAQEEFILKKQELLCKTKYLQVTDIVLVP